MKSLKITSPILKAKGYWKRDIFGFGPLWDVNYSSILTKLIHETGRLTDDYASDLFAIWKVIDKNLTDESYTGGMYGFGLRKQGVDNLDQIKRKLEDSQMYGNDPYREIYLLEIMISGDQIVMHLGKA